MLDFKITLLVLLIFQVMLKDVADSKRINMNIVEQREKDQKLEQPTPVAEPKKNQTDEVCY